MERPLHTAPAGARVFGQHDIVMALRHSWRAYGQPDVADGDVTFFIDDGELHVCVVPRGAAAASA